MQFSIVPNIVPIRIPCALHCVGNVDCSSYEHVHLQQCEVTYLPPVSGIKRLGLSLEQASESGA